LKEINEKQENEDHYLTYAEISSSSLLNKKKKL